MPDSSIGCWSVGQIIMMILAIPLLSGFIPLSLRFTYVNGSLSRVAVYFWKKWSMDNPDTRKIHILSCRSNAFNKSFLVINFISTACTVFLSSSGTCFFKSP